MENYKKELINNYIDNTFDNKEAMEKIIDREAKDENQKMIGKLALEDKKLTKDLVNFSLEESTNPSDEKTKMNKSIDIAFDNKEAMKKIIDREAKDENQKMIGKLALEDKKLTKDVANFALEESKNPSDEKTQIKKGIDIAFDNKEAINKIIDKDVKDKDFKNIGKLALEDKKLTKDVANFSLEESTNPSDEKTQIKKGIDIAFDNKEAINKIIDRDVKDKNLKNIGKLALEDKKLTTLLILL